MNISEKSDIYIISELCGQWGGSVRKAEQMMLQSKLAGADAVKVQLFDTYKLPGENRELWEYLSMSKNDYERLFAYADWLNIDFLASSFDEERFDWVRGTRRKVPVNKIASGMLKWGFEEARRQVENSDFTLCSLGRWPDDADRPFSDAANVVYMHCLSVYPHTLDQALEAMPLVFEGDMLGYSDHSMGIDACKTAIVRGAKVIEKHFTLNKGLQCSTESAHACSMNMDELKELRDWCDYYARHEVIG